MWGRLVAGIALAAIVVARASAADMPLKAPPPPPVDTWTGLYLGLNAGAGWSRNNSGGIDGTDPATAFFLSAPFLLNGNSPFASGLNQSGAAGGGQIGYNLQIGNWVSGVESDVQVANIHGSSIGSATLINDPIFRFTGSLNQSLDWFGTVRGRVGYLVTPGLLAYGTGGFAFGGTSATGSVQLIPPPGTRLSIGVGAGGKALGCQTNISTTCYTGSGSENSIGWTAGAGLEFKLTTNMTFKAEYMHVALADQVLSLVSPSPPSTPGVFMNYRFDREAFDLVRLGVNLKFLP
jgi:outer membrane immunogenic protein